MIDLRTYELHASLNSFKSKVSRSMIEIESAIKIGKALVSTSWGKDSVALCDMVRLVDPSVPLVHLKSPYELPGTEAIARHFQSSVDVTTSKSLGEYIAWLQEHGLGIDRERNAKAGRNAKANELTSWAIANGYTVQFLGMRAEEAKGRRMCFRIRGMTYPLKSGLTMSNPLAWWTARDVWAYIVSRGLPWHPLYDCETHGMTREQLRNSGWLTLARDSTDWRVPWLREHFPDQYRLLREHFPRVSLIG